ncbi:MAG: MgtC/SapB family protein [Anaerovoracaceae bacterium]
MHSLPQYFYDLTIWSIGLRLFLALVIGGAIGLERGANRHPAGFRTHILVCMGAALCMLTNQYINDVWGQISDPARMGAQVITGVGFLGVGTILITGKNRIKGLTTAAGLWASACIGLAIGIGFYEGAIIGAILIFVSLSFLPRIESYVYEHSGVLNLYLELSQVSRFKPLMKELKVMGLTVYETTLNESSPITPEGIAVSLSLKAPKHKENKEIITEIGNIEGVVLIEEL